MLILISDKGLLDLNKLKQEKENAVKKNIALKKENKKLYDIIKRLKSDDQYIEEIARKELGMIGENELIIKFNTKSKPLKEKN